MAEDLVNISESPGLRCIGSEPILFEHAVSGYVTSDGKSIASGLECEAMVANDEGEGMISGSESCILAARLVLANHWTENIVPCRTCPNREIVDNDPFVSKLRDKLL